MTNNIVEFTGITKLDLPPERILDRAKDVSLREVIVIGYDSEGEFYFAGNMADGGTALWLLETAKVKLLQCGQVIPEQA